LFEDAPWALVVTRPDGGVVGANGTARDIFGVLLDREGARCCDLLGCGTPGTALAAGCVSALALRTAAPFPEVRVDLPQAAATVASVWVVGAPLASDDGLIVLQMRAGGAGDRRRRTEPHWMSEPRLRIHALGLTQVDSPDGSLGGAWLGHRPGRVLKYLVLRREHVVPLEELLEVFAETERRRTSGSIRQAVHVLRERLEPARRRHGESAFVRAARGGYRLDAENVWVDVDDFEAHAGEGARALAAGDAAAAERHLSAAVALRRGELMSDEPYSEWVLAERDRLRDLAAECLRSLAQLRVASGDAAGAANHMIALAELEPLDVDVQKEMLRMMIRSGRHAEAERRLGHVRGRFRRQLGEELDVDLAALRREP
jgi:DNA-binding SARP family transcriptional activator